MTTRRTLLLGTAAALASPALVLAQALPPYTPNPNRLRILTGPAEGNYNAATAEPGFGFLSWLGDRALVPEGIDIRVTEGSRENVELMVAGEADLAWMQRDVYGDATRRQPAARTSIVRFWDMYEELIQVFYGTQNPETSLEDLAKAGGQVGIGPDTGGPAQTWRILTTASDDTKRFFEKLRPAPTVGDFEQLAKVRDGRKLAQMVVEGAGSARSTVANDEVSPRGRGGKPGLRLLSIDGRRFAELKDLDGEPLYRVRHVKPQQPQGKQRGFYNNLLPASGWISSGGVETLAVPCDLYIRAEWRDAIRRKDAAALNRLGRAIDSALANIRGRVNPFPISS